MSCGMCHMNDRCCHNGGFSRRFFTKEEKIAQLEKYLKDLQDEMKAVEEILKHMKEERCEHK